MDAVIPVALRLRFIINFCFRINFSKLHSTLHIQLIAATCRDILQAYIAYHVLDSALGKIVS